jgi:hypothetical protein
MKTPPRAARPGAAPLGAEAYFFTRTIEAFAWSSG